MPWTDRDLESLYLYERALLPLLPKSRLPKEMLHLPGRLGGDLPYLFLRHPSDLLRSIGGPAGHRAGLTFGHIGGGVEGCSSCVGAW